MNAREVSRCAVSVALLAVAASVTIPIGPVPFTLQTMVLAMLPVAVGGRSALVSVGAYLLLGGLGLPVFSGLSGGVGHLLGPTGGYLWGFFVGTALCHLAREVAPLPEAARDALGALSTLCVSYAVGTAQLSLVMGVSPAAALGMAVFPFVLPDLVKLCVGIMAGRSVRRALGAQEEVRRA